MRQEAVGHGGFHTGALGFEVPIFRWVYDCGSWTRKDALSRRIDAYEGRCREGGPRDTDIDLLFISHFDDDHVSGLARLIGEPGKPRLRAHTAIIPYLSPASGFEILSIALLHGECSDALIDAVLRPAKYCADRNIERLVIVRPRATPSGDPETGTRLPPRLRSTRPPHLDEGRILSSELVRPDGSICPTRREEGIEVADAEAGTVCAVVASGKFWTDWWFVPHAHEWTRNRRRIEDAAKKIVKLHPNDKGFNEKLVDKLRDPSTRSRIRDVFNPMERNQTSLSVYAGPAPDFDERVAYQSAEKQDAVGWLLTGDTPLKTKPWFEPWAESFNTIRSDVGYLMLPHHGAAGNFNAELLSFADRARCFATVNFKDYNAKPRNVGRKGPRRKKEPMQRPPQGVRRQVGDRLQAVTEEGDALVGLSGGEDLETAWVDNIARW